MNELQHGPQLPCQDLLPRKGESIKNQRTKNHKKRQKSKNKHLKNLAKGNKQAHEGNSGDLTYNFPELTSCTRDETEASKRSLVNNVHDIIKELGDKSQFDTGSRARRLRQFIRCFNVSKVKRGKLCKSKSNRPRDTPSGSSKRRFRILSKKDKESLRVQLSIWFPCLFPRPTFKVLSEAMVRMAAIHKVYHDLCRFEITGMDQKISHEKAQRTLFRKEQMHGRCSKNQPIYFASNVVPECQKRVSSFTTEFTKSSSITSMKDSINVNEFERTLMTTKIGGNFEQRPIFDVVKDRSNSLIFHKDKKYEAGTQNEDFRRNYINCEATQSVREVEIQQHHVPRWFTSMISKGTVIDILPVDSTEVKGMSFEATQLMRLKRRILLSNFNDSEKISSVNGNLFISVLEEEDATQCMNVNPAGSMSQSLQGVLIHSSSDQANRSEQNKRGSLLDTDYLVNSEAKVCVAESSSQTNATSFVSYPHKMRDSQFRHGRRSRILNYDREEKAHFSMENRSVKIRKHIRSCLEEHLAPESGTSHEPSLGMTTSANSCHHVVLLPSAGTHKTCLDINSPNSKDATHKLIDAEHALSSSNRPIKPKDTTSRQNNKKRSRPVYIPPKLNNNVSHLCNLSSTGSMISSVDLKQNIDPQMAEFCRSANQTMAECPRFIEPSEKWKPGRTKRNSQQSRRELPGNLVEILTSAIPELDLKVEASGAAELSASEQPAIFHKHNMCHKQAIDESSDTFSKECDNKKGRYVRFDMVNTCDAITTDIMNKSNSSVHGVQEVCEFDHEIVVDNLSEANGFSTATYTVCTTNRLMSATQAEHTDLRVFDGVNENLSPKEALVTNNEPNCECILGKKCSSSRSLYFDKERLSDGTTIFLENSRPTSERRLVGKTKCVESSPTCAAYRLEVRDNMNNCGDEDKGFVFGRYGRSDNPCYEKLTIANYMKDLSRQGSQQTSAASKKITFALSPRESLINFVKEQWRAQCLTSPEGNSKPVSGVDNSLTKQCLCEHKTASGDSDSTQLELSKNENSCPYSQMESPFHLQEVECDCKKSNSPLQEPSYETMCTERRENYRKLCQTLTNHYQSISPEEVHNAHITGSSPVIFMQSSDAELSKTHAELKISDRLDKTLLESQYDIPNNSPASTVSDEQMALTTTDKIFHTSLEKKGQCSLEKPTFSSASRSFEQCVHPKSCNSADKERLKLRNELGASFSETKYRNITLDQQTQTTSTSSIQAKDIHDSIISMLNLSGEETEWLMDKVQSWETTDPKKPSEFYCLLFAFDKLLARYFRPPFAETHQYKNLKENNYQHTKTSTAESDRARNSALSKEYALSYSPVALHRRECINPPAEKYSRQVERNEDMSELAQNSSVNNGQDSPPMFSQNRYSTYTNVPLPEPIRRSGQARTDPTDEKQKSNKTLNKQRLVQVGKGAYKSPTGYISQSPNGSNSQSPNGNNSQSPNGNISQSPNGNISQSPNGNISQSPNGNISQSPNGNISQSPNGNVSKAPARYISKAPAGNIVNSQTGYVSRFPAWNIPKSTNPSQDQKESAEMASFVHQRMESNLVKEFTDPRPALPSRLLLMPKNSKNKHIPTDTKASIYTKAQAPSQQSKGTQMASHDSTGQLQKFPIPAAKNETISRPTFPNEDYTPPIRKLAFDVQISHKRETLNDNYRTKNVNPYISPENFHSETILDTSKNWRLPKSCRSILNYSPHKKYSSATSDDTAPPDTPTCPYHHPRRLEFENKTTWMPHFNSGQAGIVAFPSNDRSVISPKRNTQPHICQEYDMRTNRQNRSPCKMSPARILFRDIFDDINKTSTPTGSLSRQQSHSQVESRFDREMRIAVERTCETKSSCNTQNRCETKSCCNTHTRCETKFRSGTPRSTTPTRSPFVLSGVNKESNLGDREISNSPRQRKVCNFRPVEVDNRLLDPSKCYNDLCLLHDSCRQEPRTRNCSVFLQEYNSSKPNTLTNSSEENSNLSSGEILNASPTKQYKNVPRPVQNVANLTTEFRLDRLCQSASSSKPKKTNNYANVCIQTCACISKPNGRPTCPRTCLCGTLSITEKWEPKEITNISPSKFSKNTKHGINRRSVCIQTSCTEMWEKQTNARPPEFRNGDLGSQSPVHPGRRKQPSPRQTKYRNKKCQVRCNGALKSNLSSPVPCQQIKSKARSCKSPVNIKCLHGCLDSYKINYRKPFLQKDTAICSNCKQLLDNATQQLETLNLSTEYRTNSSDENQSKLCQTDDFLNYEIGLHMSDLFATRDNVPVCSKSKPKQKSDLARHVNCDSRSDQESNVIVAHITQSISSEKLIRVKEQQPTQHIRYRSEHGVNSPQHGLCSKAAHMLSQQLKEQISGIIKNSKLLQQQAAQLRNECKRLDQQQWPSVKWSGQDTPCECRQCYNRTNLVPECENNSNNPQKPSDQNTNANPRCDQELRGENNLNDLSMPTSSNITSLTSNDEYRNVHENKSGINYQSSSVSIPIKLSKEIHTRNTKFINKKYDDRSYALYSRKMQTISPGHDDNNINIESSHCDFPQHNLDHKIHLFTQECLPLIENYNQSWNAFQEGVTEKYGRPVRSVQEGVTEKYGRPVRSVPEGETEKYGRPVRSVQEGGTEKNGRPVRSVQEGETEKNGRPVRSVQEGGTEKNGRPVRSVQEGETEKNGRPVRSVQEGGTEKNGRPVRPLQQGVTKKNTRLHEHSNLHYGQYFFNDPSEEAYQYVRDNFPAISMRQLNEEGSNPTIDTHEGSRSCSKIVFGGVLQLLETKLGVACSATEQITGASTLGAKQCMEDHDLRTAKLRQSSHLPGRSLPGRNNWSDTYEAVVPYKTRNYFGGRNTKYLGGNINPSGSDVKLTNSNEARSSIPKDKESLSLISAYMNDADTLPSKSYWHWAYTIGSPTQSARPVRRAKNNTNGVDMCHNKPLYSHKDTHILSGSPVLISDRSDASSFRGLHNVTRSVGATVSCTTQHEQNNHQRDATPIAGNNFVVPPTTDDSCLAHSNYRSRVTGSLLQSINMSGTNASMSSTTNSLFGNIELITPDVCAKNTTNSHLHLSRDSVPALGAPGRNTEYLEGRDTSIEPDESSPVESTSETSLISIERVLNPVESVTVSRCESCTVTSADRRLSRLQSKMTTLCEEEKKILDQDDKSAESDLVQRQNGDKLQQRKKRYSAEDNTADNAITLDQESWEKYELVMRNKHRILPEIKHCNRPTHNRTAVDSQDSSHGIEDLPLDSAFTQVNLLEHVYTGNKGKKPPEIISNKDPRIEYKANMPVHKRALLARPLPFPRHEGSRTIIKDPNVEPTNKDLKENNIPNNGINVVYIETAALPSPQAPASSAKPKRGYETVEQITLGGEWGQFEVSMTCTDSDAIVSETSNKESIMWRNSPGHLKKRNERNDIAKKFRARPLSNKALDDSETSVSSSSFRFLPEREYSNRKSRHIDALASGSGTAATSSHTETSFSRVTVQEEEMVSRGQAPKKIPPLPSDSGTTVSPSRTETEEIPSHSHAPKNTPLFANETKTDTSNQWRPCLFGCAEVISANDESVIIEGAYVKRFSSGMKFNEVVAHINNKVTETPRNNNNEVLTPTNNNNEVESERLGWQHRKVTPFRLMFSKDMAPGDTNHVTGTYSRQLLTSDSFFAWNFLVDKL